MIATYQYLAEGAVWHSGELNTNHTDPQAFADALAALPLNRPADEFRVWFGPVTGIPDAVAYRPLSTEGVS